MNSKIKQHFDNIASQYKTIFSKSLLRRSRDYNKRQLAKILSDCKGEDILDSGCGVGLNCQFVKELGANPYGIDFSLRMIEELHRNGFNGEVQDLERFNLGRKFDKIICIGVFEFCKDHLSILFNFRKHLKDNGCVVLHISNYSLFSLLYFSYHLLITGINIKLFSSKEIYKLVHQAGFVISDKKKLPLSSVLYKLRKSHI